ncbi:hypothetical protein GDO86_019471 [Hymenochirus boettgeri]|uniref:Uncharacterized protein n=1 Tax=Hymenochirus boettgeri TaxID=247094 RepID=A0A8T2ILM8_9PIPI|nr:hypothetical protein GDO86_019471 [Hymenochirus boettgeri]
MLSRPDIPYPGNLTRVSPLLVRRFRSKTSHLLRPVRSTLDKNQRFHLARAFLQCRCHYVISVRYPETLVAFAPGIPTRKANSRGDFVTAKKYSRIALVINITAAVIGVGITFFMLSLGISRKRISA